MKLTIEHDDSGLCIESENFRAFAEYIGVRIGKTGIERIEGRGSAQGNGNETGELLAVTRAYAAQTRVWHSDESGYTYRSAIACAAERGEGAK